MLPDEPQADLPLPDDSADSGPAYPESASEPMPTAPPKEADSAAAEAPPPVTPPQPRQLTFLPSIRFVFDNPDWMVSILMGSVCLFIPVFGQIALFGYMFEIVESLYRSPQRTYPKFEFARLGDYCVRGVWPYVLMQAVQIVLQLILQLPIQFSVQGMMILMINNPQVGGIVMAIGAPVILLFLISLALAVSLFTAPIMLRAGLTQDIRLAFRQGWINWYKGYLKRVWVQEILATLFLGIASAVLIPLGCLLLCYGAFAASVVLLIAGAHLKWQIYEIYLERGGEPIQLHPLPADEPPVAAPLAATEFEPPASPRQE